LREEKTCPCWIKPELQGMISDALEGRKILENFPGEKKKTQNRKEEREKKVADCLW